MAIYLTGGGDQGNFKKLDQHFLNKLPDNANILVVPQACDDYQDALDRVKEEFKSKKISQIKLLNHPNKMTWAELESYDAMIIEGGNTFQLIKAIRESSFFQFLVFLLNLLVFSL